MTETWNYINSSTIEITGDVTSRYWPNLLISITQNSTQKFFVITEVNLVSGNTRLTVHGGGIYSVNNNTITAHAVTQNQAIKDLPYGFSHLNTKMIQYAITGSLYNRKGEFIISPTSTPSSLSFYGDYVSVANNLECAYSYSILMAGLFSATLQKGATASTGLDGLLAQANNYGNSPNSKALWAAATNYARSAGFTYGIESYVHNWSLSADYYGNIDTARGIRLRMQNIVQSANAVANAIITLSQAIYANTYNGASSTDLKATIETAVGFEYDIENAIGGEITNSYGIKLNAPVNSGALTNHWGIYLADQTVSGTTTNYAIYVAGGKVHFENDLYVGGDCSALTFTDRTPVYQEDALAAIQGIKSDENGNIIHSTLPEFAIMPYFTPEKGWEPGRSIGDMVSVLTTAIQQLIKHQAVKDAQIADLTKRIQELEKH